jgi:hypothetical protein
VSCSLRLPNVQRLRVAISCVSCAIFKSRYLMALSLCAISTASAGLSCKSSSTLIGAMFGNVVRGLYRQVFHRAESTRIVASSPSRCHGSPTTSARSFSSLSASVVPLALVAHTNEPLCSRLAHSHSPKPYWINTFIRLPRRLAKRYA